jgi:CHAD domain-containing protein
MDKSIKKIQGIFLQHLSDLAFYRQSLRAKIDQEKKVHRMRVATRRLREVLGVFREGKDDSEVRRHLKKVRRLGRALGACRSLDVSRQLLQKRFTAADPATARCATLKMDGDRKKCEKALRRELEASDFQGLRRDLERFSRDFSAEKKSVARYLEKAVKKRKKDFRKNLSRFDLSVTARMHKIRIQLKKIRYLCEIAAQCGDAASRRALKIFKRIQTFLGDWHDAVVLADFLGDLYKNKKRREPDLGRRFKALSERVRRDAERKRKLAVQALKTQVI